MTLNQETTLKSYKKHLKDDIKSILDNFVEILKLVKVDLNENSHNYLNSSRIQENYEMNVRAANICRAAQSISKLIYSIKQFIIINDFPLINEAISNKTSYFKVNEIDNKLITLRDEISSELFDLEEDFYSSIIK
ncbi:mediator of RNA polymerase II transcription subunit 22-like protein [Dinothrombium tinctorium]|uniref:Mediator of RNA polymerase II transcription subunit 22 n=1 Tax=Dinothrombium tinctorium TaxID=1965070 RepID=A0A3S3P1A7_9ACAR|nr:mediator of RNA polymerase II transcription subunit 22-like protein [Dinothrombium tinctorium]RWS05906.1 mediator of RNA polymerase II transcription subunit 22-like protein [Dinothrombium tinctorium]RWS05985.1 mediator of RNA polymerase II transcription subunit 22-like protein [Dinothrombium tinctorium]